MRAFSYHAKQDAYVLGTSISADFKLPEDDFHSYWNEEGKRRISDQDRRTDDLIFIDTKFLPQGEQGSVKLLDGNTYQIIDRYTPIPPSTAVRS